MPTTERDRKLVQYLNEAYGKEKELEAALGAHIGMTTRAPYKRRLQQHLRETKDHSRRVERRIKQLGGDPQTLRQRVTGQATAALKGPLHALRGKGEEERLLKNAKTEFSEEAEEIATYSAIEVFAESVADRDTAKLARGIKREEERMANYLQGLIPQLTRAVVRAEVPSDQRSNGRRRSRRTSSSSSGSRRGSSTRRSGSGSRGRSSTRATSRSRAGGSRRGASSNRSRSRGGTRSRRGRSGSRS